MAFLKEPTNPSRPPPSGGLPVRQNISRTHSHSISLGAINPTHRINRRKSAASSTASNAAAAVVAVLGDGGDASTLSTSSHRRSLGSKKGLESTSMGGISGYGSYFARAQDSDRKDSAGSEADSAIADGVEQKPTVSKARNRRASEGAQLIRGEGKRVSNELRCDTCGKGYKHSSCLTKHMWEHDPAWAITSKLLISKHQQVQLLEAASVLCTMNTEGSSEQDSSNVESEGSSASPVLSGISDPHDDLSSAETTPPPVSDGAFPIPSSKRYSTSSTSYSRSYHSIGSVPSVSPGLRPHRLSGTDYRPTTSGADDTGLVAAAELLGFGTPRTRPTQMSPDIPPVPPLPERYQAANRLSGLGPTPTIYNPLGMHPPALTQQLSDERDCKMDLSFERRNRDSGLGMKETSHIDEDEGMFGKMEE